MQLIGVENPAPSLCSVNISYQSAGTINASADIACFALPDRISSFDFKRLSRIHLHCRLRTWPDDHAAAPPSSVMNRRVVLFDRVAVRIMPCATLWRPNAGWPTENGDASNADTMGPTREAAMAAFAKSGVASSVNRTCLRPFGKALTSGPAFSSYQFDRDRS
jgi:hypothetical protein